MRNGWRLALIALAVWSGVACITHVEQRAIALDPAGQAVIVPLACNGNGPYPVPEARRGALDPAAIRLITWNIHKNNDKDWDRDLERFAAGHGLVLLQEARLNRPLRAILERTGHGWVLASAFLMNTRDTGVMTAAAHSPVSACFLREIEPVIGLPKTALITHHALAGRDDTLAIANIHSINMSLALGAYSAQLDAVARELERHPGPLILAGDLNTWTAGRREVVQAIAAKLGLREIHLAHDGRSRFWGQQVDYVFVRGLDVVEAHSIEVTSSDHNPVSTLLRIAAP